MTATTTRPALADRVDALDWNALEALLDEHGFAVTEPLLDEDECAALAALFDGEGFRSTIDMARHRFGDGRYRYFDHPLPEAIAELRGALYRHLAPVGNRWAGLLSGESPTFPVEHDELLERCRAAGQERPTPLILRYGAGDWNALHQDLYGDVFFPLQALTVLTDEHEGGEFVLLEQRPRAQSRAHVLRPPRGAFVLFPTRERPARGRRGHPRAGMRHGVATVTAAAARRSGSSSTTPADHAATRAHNLAPATRRREERGMRAAVTREPNVMEVADVPDAPGPGPGEALLRPEAIGLCGSDYHFLTGEIVTTTVHGPQFPKIQGHEVSAIIERLGPDAPSHLEEGQRVAIWPLRGCGECYACSIGRSNVCPNFSLIGIHVDGALAQRITLPAEQLFPVGDLEPAVAAFVEPISIAVHAVNRGRVAEGEHVVVLGAGPIGQALAIAARERGAKVLLVDLVAGRLELGRLTGADVLDASGVDDVVAEAKAWSGGEGPQVVFDAVGIPTVVQQAVDMVVSAGRVVIVGISEHRVDLSINTFTAKEIDVLGTSVCDADAFREAAAIVGRNADVISRLISRRYPLERAPEAIAWAMAHPQDALKVVVEV